jgi:hypothetical protein
MANADDLHPVLVQVVPVDGGREIGWGDGVAEWLRDRLADIHEAMRDGSAAIGGGLRHLAQPDGWRVDEVTATFGIALAAEAGVILGKASGEATFEVCVTYRRTGD